MAKWMVIGGVAMALLLLTKRSQAAPNNPYDVRNWEAMPGYSVGSGRWM